MLIDQQGAAGTQGEPGGRGQRRLGTHPGREQDQVGGECGPVGQLDHGAAAGVPHGRDRRGEPDIHPGVAQLQLDAPGQLRIQGGQHLAGQLDHGDVQAPVAQRLGHLQADEPRADQHGPPGPAVQQGA